MSSAIITIKLTPKASRTEVRGWEEDADGNTILKCSVTTVPEKGKANKALIALLSKHYRIPKRDITILKGETDRIKVIEILGFSAFPNKNL